MSGLKNLNEPIEEPHFPPYPDAKSAKSSDTPSPQSEFEKELATIIDLIFLRGYQSYKEEAGVYTIKDGGPEMAKKVYLSRILDAANRMADERVREERRRILGAVTNTIGSCACEEDAELVKESLNKVWRESDNERDLGNE